MAWEAFLAGTVPVGATVVSAEGVVVACGRNRVWEPRGSRLAGSRLAHAEVDGLAQLPTSARYRDHVLYSSLEPCLLCVGATLQSTVGAIEYVAPDPFGGGCSGTIDTVQWRRTAPQIGNPLGGWAARISLMLQSAFWLEQTAHPKARDIVDAFGVEAQAAAERLLALTEIPNRLVDALPRIAAFVE